MIYKRLLAFLLSFALIFSSTSALANTSIGGWTALDTITAGATNTINATKTAGGKALKSVITIAPQAGKVGKYLLRGGAAGALALAVPQILGEGVDWVLDPANNRVKYNSAVAPSVTATPSDRYRWLYADIPYRTAEGACRAGFGDGSSGYTFAQVILRTSAADCYAFSPTGERVLNNTVYRSNNPIYNAGATPNPTTEEKYLPIADVAAQVVANAEAGDVPSQEAVKAVALEGFAAGEHDAALDAAAVPDTGVENPTDPADPVDPAKPVDLSPITAAINALKAILSGILSSITSLADWFKGEPEANKPEDNKIDIPEVPLPDIDSSVSFGGSCPDDLGADFNLYGTNFNFVLMPFSKLCPLLSTFIKPTLILLGSFMAVAIVGGRKDA